MKISLSSAVFALATSSHYGIRGVEASAGKKSASATMANKLYYGGASAFPGNSWRTFVQTDANGSLDEVGVEFGAAQLANLPQDPSNGNFDVRNEQGDIVAFCCGHDLVLDFPEEAYEIDGFVFDHLFMNWNPEGHNPPGVFDVPHFDWHFYMVEREDIVETWDLPVGLQECEGIPIPVSVQCKDALASMSLKCEDQQMPQGHFVVPAFSQAMGNHLASIFEPTISSNFTETWIYGHSYGEIIFVEPMVTLELIEEIMNTDKKRVYSIARLGECVFYPGLYPAQYSISFDEDAGTLSVTMFDWYFVPKCNCGSGHKGKKSYI